MLLTDEAASEIFVTSRKGEETPSVTLCSHTRWAGRWSGRGVVPPPGKLVRTSAESWEGGGEVSLDSPSFQCPSLDGSHGQDCRRHVTGSIRLAHGAKLVSSLN